jgi:hypothetical protein
VKKVTDKIEGNKERTERISTWFLSKLSSVRVESKKTIWALTMVWMFVVGGLSMWDNLDGVTERRATLPGPVAVLNESMEGNWDKERESRRTPSTLSR